MNKAIVLIIMGLLLHSMGFAQYANQKYQLVYPGHISNENKDFLEMLIPDIIQANNEILWNRQRIESIDAQFRDHCKVTTTSLHFLDNISQCYKADFRFSIKTTPTQFASQIKWLLNRVDKVPMQLVLAQAALESEWGRSRFAIDGYNYFGIRCYKADCGMQPASVDNPSFMVRSYDSPLDGVRDYLYNINVGSAYKALRMSRSQQRSLGQNPDPLVLASSLLEYSEIGEDYYTRISWLIRKKIPQISLVPYEEITQK